VLEKDLLKFEAIYPPDTKPLGSIRKHDIYPRGNVYTLQGELNWIRQARSVREGEEPYKVVKARPKLSIPADQRVQLYLNTYGYWQTEPYVPPRVVDGKIPRNEHGNVYMYQPQM
jgi:xeroderma pigmentosum group C-complementing protein